MGEGRSDFSLAVHFMVIISLLCWDFEDLILICSKAACPCMVEFLVCFIFIYVCVYACFILSPSLSNLIA